MNTITNRFQVEELEQRLEMAKWNLDSGIEVPDGTICYPEPDIPFDSSILK